MTLSASPLDVFAHGSPSDAPRNSRSARSQFSSAVPAPSSLESSYARRRTASSSISCRPIIRFPSLRLACRGLAALTARRFLLSGRPTFARTRRRLELEDDSDFFPPRLEEPRIRDLRRPLLRHALLLQLLVLLLVLYVRARVRQLAPSFRHCLPNGSRLEEQLVRRDLCSSPRSWPSSAWGIGGD